MAIDKFLVEASHIMMFARSVGDDNPIYHDEVDQGKKWLLANLPFYSRWYRFLLFYPGSDQLLDSLFIDPSWKEGHSINQDNDAMRQLFTEAMMSQISDESLIEKVIPKYPPFGKRMLQDNGAWLRALHLPNVNLLTEGITDMFSKGIISSNWIWNKIFFKILYERI